MLNTYPSGMHSMPNFAVLERQSRHESGAKQKQAAMFVSDILKKLTLHLVQRISLHFKSPDFYLFCTTKVFPKSLLPCESQASFQSEEFGSFDYAQRSLSVVACSLSSLVRMLLQKRPLFVFASLLDSEQGHPKTVSF